ncbi:hypothetical protein PV08_01086 [Exophiala spinifera]|uniref:FAD-binding FR-type domain-containing protein n=1 Tax=Exophiala spinifera TaxID=91928 RepID=A0A0D1YZ37_9EURO|nr:uncharacterized protein PV08_01086 [Exophiala spinifera]KIW20511.1 hypothetical protein PV08_01086 [Exophiala spinifera]
MAYKFVGLSPEQIEARRHALDRAGWYAWLSPLVLMAVVGVCRRVLAFWSSVGHGRGQGQGHAHKLPKLPVLLRRLNWVLGTTYLSPEFGPLSVQVCGVAYTGWLLYLVFRGTGEDYMHVTKAFGHVGVSQMPLQYLLSVKWPASSSSSSSSSSFPYGPVRSFAAGTLSHEKLNVYHRLLGRVVHAFLAAHAVLYLRFFAQMGWLEKRVRDWDVRFGLLAFWALNALALLSVPAIRRRAYHALFWRSHVVLGVAVPLFVFAHVKYTRVYVAQVAIVWAVNFVVRTRASEIGQVTCENVQGTIATTTTTTTPIGGTVTTGTERTKTSVLVKVKIIAKKGGRLAKATPGQHVFLHSSSGGGGVAAKNPFTIVSVTTEANKEGVELVLVVRGLGGPGTKGLADLAKTGKKVDMRVEGPYGNAHDDVDRLVNAGTASPVLLVAGGVGATYTIPIYMSLLNHARKTGKRQGILEMVWLVKGVGDAAWGVEILRQLHDERIDVDLYITGEDPDPSLAQGSDLPSEPEIHGLKIHAVGRRPDLTPEVDGFFTASASNGGDVHHALSDEGAAEVNVFVCGPSSLSADLRKVVGRHVGGKGRQVRWIEEAFGFGGS